jgi:class 3 adenylate cyclase
VLFVDVRGYTSLAEKLPPAEVVERLNRFYDIASNAIFERDGTLDKLVGDQAMAFFGAPLHAKDHPRRAVETGLKIFSAMNDLAPDHNLQIGAGVASGEAFVGNVGGSAVTDYTVIGDTVNIAARLQGAAASGELLVSEATYAQVAAEFPSAPSRDLELKGKNQMVRARVIQNPGQANG